MYILQVVMLVCFYSQLGIKKYFGDFPPPQRLMQMLDPGAEWGDFNHWAYWMVVVCCGYRRFFYHSGIFSVDQ